MKISEVVQKSYQHSFGDLKEIVLSKVDVVPDYSLTKT